MRAGAQSSEDDQEMRASKVTISDVTFVADISGALFWRDVGLHCVRVRHVFMAIADNLRQVHAAQAERLRRAKIIDAEGELQAAERLAQAGEILSKRPESMQLRYLGTLLNIAGERSNTIVFPLPRGDLAKTLGLGEKK